MFVYNKQKSRIDNAETSRNKYDLILTREKYSRNFIIKNNEYKIQNILNPYFWEITSENQKKNKNRSIIRTSW